MKTIKKLATLIITMILLCSCDSGENIENDTQDYESTTIQTTTEFISETTTEATTTEVTTTEPEKLLDPDVRNIKWGMSAEEVRKYENITGNGHNYEEFEESIWYNTEILGFSTNIGYIFRDDKLRRVAYLFDFPYADSTYRDAAFLTIRTSYIEVYGEPKSESGIHIDGRYSDWETDRTMIRVSIDYPDFGSFNATYDDKNYEAPPIDNSGI